MKGLRRSVTPLTDTASCQCGKESIGKNYDAYICVHTRWHKMTRRRREWRRTKGPKSRDRVTENIAVERYKETMSRILCREPQKPPTGTPRLQNDTKER